MLGIDPGNKGAFVLTNGRELKWWPMPLDKDGKNEWVDHDGVKRVLVEAGNLVSTRLHVWLERPVSFGMSTKGAFTYGRGYEALMIAIRLTQMPVTLVEPSRWTKAMHEGISSDLKPKIKSGIAVNRLYPHMVGQLPVQPKKRLLLEGPMDALLIAGYGLRSMAVRLDRDTGDFY